MAGMQEFKHIPVLLPQAIAALKIRPEGCYVDCTAGGGGHSSAIAAQLQSGGRLIAVDRDPQAIAALQDRLGANRHVTIVQQNFFYLRQILDRLDIHAVDGILADLGVSSHQLDVEERGFSYHGDAPLDMRMDPTTGRTAADAVNTLSQEQLRTILYQWGEEKYAPQIAAGIVNARQRTPIRRTEELTEIIKQSVPAKYRRKEKHPARKTFQALRIYVNGELDGLDTALDGLFDCLQPGGRLAVITFHSLEDRLVKRNFVKHCTGCECPPEFPVCVCGKTPAGHLPVKSITPSSREVEENPRSRSARLRVIEKEQK